MLIAQQKLQENIAEYILYMYQVEDVIRAYQFDLDRIVEEYVKPNLPDSSFLNQYREWYRKLIVSMQSQRIEKSGHMAELNEIVMELSYLHNTLLNLANDEKYRALTEQALPMIDEFKERSNLKEKNNIEVMLHAMYMKLLLKLQKKEISAETENAFDNMRAQLAYLVRAYHQMKRGELNFFNN